MGRSQSIQGPECPALGSGLSSGGHRELTKSFKQGCNVVRFGFQKSHSGGVAKQMREGKYGEWETGQEAVSDSPN